MAAAYLTVCPNCGAPLQPVVAGPDSAPWLCPICHLGCWVAELEQSGLWDPASRCFGHTGRAAREAAVEAEARDAAGRGISVRPDQLALLNVQALRQAAKLAGKAFAAQVNAAIRAKGS